MVRATATWLAGRRALPTSVRAVCGFYGDTGVFDLHSLRLKRKVDAVTEAMIDDAFEEVEAAIADDLGRESTEFAYDTKLILPAQLTLGYLYRRLDDPNRRDRAEALTRLAIEALLDGDMRDAINDDEFEDFEVTASRADVDRERAAVIAQSTLETRVESGLADFPPAVRDAYEWAVEVSQSHQDDDEHFRNLFAAAEDSNDDALRAIEAEYRDADFETQPETLQSADATLPYAKTQYERVGVIYDGMLRMYEAGGFEISDAFSRSIVLAIVGAQIWLDDVDDYRADRRKGQLTPVTAEYLLAAGDSVARERVVDIAETYLDRAMSAATDADSPLTGIATEYIHRSGDPSVLPGGRE